MVIVMIYKFDLLRKGKHIWEKKKKWRLVGCYSMKINWNGWKHLFLQYFHCIINGNFKYAFTEHEATTTLKKMTQINVFCCSDTIQMWAEMVEIAQSQNN